MKRRKVELVNFHIRKVSKVLSSPSKPARTPKKVAAKNIWYVKRDKATLKREKTNDSFSVYFFFHSETLALNSADVGS